MKYDGLTDAELWQLLKNGDKQALSYLFHEYYGTLHHYGFKLSGNTGLVEDCLQELFLYIYERRTSLGNVNNIRSYLFKSFRRSIIRTMRNERKAVYVSLDDSWIVIPSELANMDRDEEQLKILADLINNLAPRQREMIYLRYYNDLSPREISEMLGVSYRGVVNTLYKAMVNLRQDIDKLQQY